MSEALYAAVIGRLNGTEVIPYTDVTAEQTALVALLVPDTANGNKAWIRQEQKPSSVPLPESGEAAKGLLTFFEQDGGAAIQGPDAFVRNVILRFTAWSNSRDGVLLPRITRRLENLLDDRKWQVDLPLSLATGKCFSSTLFTGPSSPMFDTGADLWFSLLSFNFVEYRL